MCGRFAVARPATEIMEELEAEAWDDIEEYAPSWNVAPTLRAPVLVASDCRRLALMRWGLVPFWAKDPEIGNRMINARAETLADKPAFRHLVGRRHGLVAADGFYEWQRQSGGKQPHFIRRADGGMMTFAALWDTWQPPNGPVLVTFTIVTCEPTTQLAAVHNRMPVILRPPARARWLDPQTPTKSALELLRPDTAELELYPVSKAVNSPRNDGPELVRPQT